MTDDLSHRDTGDKRTADTHRTHGAWRPSDIAECDHPGTPLPLSGGRNLCLKCRAQWAGELVR